MGQIRTGHRLHIVEPARPEEITPALHLVFQHLPHDERTRRVANALGLLAAGELEEKGIHVARNEGRLVGAMAGLSLPGAGGLVWLPGALPSTPHGLCEDLLVASVCSWLKSRGAKVIRAILSPTDLSRAASLLSNGFAQVTQLLYLRHDLHDIPASTHEIGIGFQPYTPANDGLFRETLLQTYEGTLDCPELNGVRTIEEIVEGHKAQGAFDASRWWLMTKFDRAAGVVLLTRVAEMSAWDISYVGIVPAARGVGVGRAAVTRALQEAQLFGADQLTVAVDARNTPARQLYLQLGFEPTATREVFLRFLARSPSVASPT